MLTANGPSSVPSPDLGLGGAEVALLNPSRRGRATHVPFPLRGTPRLLIPRRPASASAAAVRTSTTATSTRSRLLSGAGQALARLGATRWIPQAVALGGPGTFLHHMEELAGQKVVASVHLGPPRANRKPVVHLMDLHGRSVAFVKLGINELTCQRVRQEAEALRRLAEVSTPGLVVPELLQAGQWEGLDYLTMRPVATGSGLTSTRELRARVLRALADAFPRSKPDLAESPWWSRIVADLDRCDDDRESTTLRLAATSIVDRYGDVPVPQGAGHGDFSPWNVCAHSEYLAVWDWERFALDVPIGWDEIHFSLNASSGGPAAGLAKPHRDMVERLDPQTGSMPQLLIATYLLNRGVNFLVDRQSEAGLRRGPLNRWLLPALETLVGLREP